MKDPKQVVCDVLVAGSGAAGFATALTASLEGLDVIMVEKEPLFGGTTAYSAGVIWIPANSYQKAGGVGDSPEDALRYLMHHVGNRLDRDKAQAFVNTASRMLDLFEREGFVKYSPALTWADYHPDEPGGAQGGRSLCPEEFDGRKLGPWFDKLRPPIKTMTAFGGMMVGRNDLPHVYAMTRSTRSAMHVAGMLARQARDRLSYARGTRLVNGNALIASMAASAFKRGVQLWLKSPVVEVIREGERVTGAMVRRDGQFIKVVARRGVVLASGGFPQNDSLKWQLYPHLAAGQAHLSLPPPGNTGDGLRLAEAVGGRLHDDVHHPSAWTPVSLVPQPDGSVIPFPHFFDRGKPGYIAVDRRGKRFVNEAKSYHVFVPAMIEACRNDENAEAWIVCDHRAIRRFGLGALGPAPMRIAPFATSTDQGSRDGGTLRNVPGHDTTVGVDLTWRTQVAGSVATETTLRLAERNALDDFGVIGLTHIRRYPSQVTATLGLGRNLPAYETAALRVGGAKDEASVNLAYDFSKREYARVGVFAARFHTQARTDVGSGQRVEVETGYRIRTDYPNLTARLYAAHSRFDREPTTDALASRLNPDGTVPGGSFFLPPSFNVVAAAIGFGHALRTDYSRGIRPFADVGVSYNSIIGRGFNAMAGIGGSVLGNDHLSVGVSRARGGLGIYTGTSEVFLRYQLYF